MNIRKYHSSDNEKIIELLRLNTPQYFSPEEEKDLADYLVNHAGNYYVIETGGNILGCGGFNFTEDGQTARISWDIIHPEYHGKGLGGKLTEFRLRKMKETAGVQAIAVRTSQLVYKFYEKFGLETKEVVKDFWAEGFDLYSMECDVDSICLDD